MRRKDRELSQEETLRVIERSSFGVLSGQDVEGKSYSVPLSLAYKNQALYFHGAKTGTKLEMLRSHPFCSVCFVSEVEIANDDFTCFFESAIARGYARELTQDKERREALKVICEKYVPQLMDGFDSYLARFDKATSVWRIEVEELTGKRKNK